MSVQRGFWAVLTLTIIAFVVLRQEGPGELVAPVFVSSPDKICYVEFSFPCLGHKITKLVSFSDAVGQEILLNELKCPVCEKEMKLVLKQYLAKHHVESGQRLTIVAVSMDQLWVLSEYMGAAQRQVLGIPLHPDRMTEADWSSLPGIGEKMATAIVEERRRNGAFGSFLALKRVRGIADKKIKFLQPLFE